MTEERDDVPQKIRIKSFYRKIVPFMMLLVVISGTVYSIVSFSSESTQSSYSLHYVSQASGAGQGTYIINNNLVTDCSGESTNAFTPIKSGNSSLSAQISIASVNVTNLFIYVELIIGTTPPGVAFVLGSGCGTLTCRWIGSMFMPVIGASNWFTQSFTVTTSSPGGFCPALTVGTTYYAWFDIQTRNNPNTAGHDQIRAETINGGGMYWQEDK